MLTMTTTLVGLFLMAVSAALVAWNVRTWRADRSLTDSASPPDANFAWRQFRRRVQASGMIGLVGALICGGQFLTTPWPLACLWTGVVLLVFWILLLALADIAATNQHFGRQQRGNLADLARVRQELDRRSSHRGNGHRSG